MKKNRVTKLAILVLALAIASMMLVSGTYAKYTHEYSGTSTATVAKFKVGEISSSTFTLFDTVKEADATTTEEHVVAGKIAPGTGGSFQITVTNESEVAVTYNLAISETSNTQNVPIEYSLDGTTYSTAAAFASAASSSGTLGIGSSTATTANVTVYWRWAFTGATSTNYTSSQTDTTDTTLGEYGTGTAPTVVVTVTATYTQID